ncbi:serine/threonine-protein kinase [soil metagenome]
MITQGEFVAGRYRLGPLLGRGGMADVHLADDDRDGHPVAVKLLREVGTVDEARFEAEVDVLRLLDHPALVRLRDSGTWEGRPYLVMDFVDGLSLAERLRGGALDADTTRELGQRLAGGLAHAHDLGVIHRDVKPANILLDHDGRPRLADFGIARLADTTGLTATGMVMGTAAYLAPEQLRGEKVGPAADLYALGLVLIESHTGRRCYDGPSTEAAMARLSRSPGVPADLPAWWRDLLVAMTATLPWDRPTAAAAHAALAEGSSPADPTGPVPALAPTEAIAIRGGDTALLHPPPPAAPRSATTTRPATPQVTRPATPYWLRLAIGLVAVAMVALIVGFVLSGGLSDDPAPTDPADGPAPSLDLPAELTDALDRLGEAVEP